MLARLPRKAAAVGAVLKAGHSLRGWAAFFCLSFMALACQAQQTHQYTQYIFNQYGHNPAVAGSKKCVEGRMGAREQWWGFEGAPLSLYASMYGRLRNKTRNVHGLGVYIQRDDLGPTSKTSFSGSYAYHVPVGLEARLGLGIAAGLQQFRFDANKVSIYQRNDPAIGGSGSALIYPDISAGLWFYTKQTYIGLAGLQLLKRPMPGLGPDSKITPHFNFTGGYATKGNNYYSLQPSFMLKFTPLAPPSLDLNLMMTLRQRFSYGISYRVQDAVALLVRVRLFKVLDVGYSFDFITSRIREGAPLGSHEISLGFSGCYKKESLDYEICPAYN